jgi:hypothetical protein
MKISAVDMALLLTCHHGTMRPRVAEEDEGIHVWQEAENY